MREYKITRTTDTGFPVVSYTHDGCEAHEVRILYGMTDVEWFNQINEQHWFTDETKQFFGSRIGATL